MQEFASHGAAMRSNVAEGLAKGVGGICVVVGLLSCMAAFVAGPMRAAACALAAALLVVGCGKAADPAPASAARPTDDEVRAALKAHYYAHAPKGVVQKSPPDFAAFKVSGCSKSSKEGFECDIVNPAGMALKGKRPAIPS